MYLNDQFDIYVLVKCVSVFVKEKTTVMLDVSEVCLFRLLVQPTIVTSVSQFGSKLHSEPERAVLYESSTWVFSSHATSGSTDIVVTNLTVSGEVASRNENIHVKL